MTNGNDLVVFEKISKMTGYSASEIAVVKKVVAKGTSDVELAYFLNVAKSLGLNPFLKEIVCYHDRRGNLIVFAGRDGFLKKAQQDARWNGLTSAAVYSNDDFQMSITDGKIKHIPSITNRGELLGAYAITKPKGCEYPTAMWVKLEDYDRGTEAHNTPWSTHKEAMIIKVAETHVLKRAYGITGLQVEYDWDFHDGIAVPHGTVKKQSDLQKKIIEALDKYDGEDKEDIKRSCLSAIEQGKFDEEFAKRVAGIIGYDMA